MKFKGIRNILLAATVLTMPSVVDAQEQRVLRLGLYGGVWQQYLTEGVVANFEKATGAKVVMDVSTGNQFMARLRASNGSNPPFDVLPLQPYSTEALAKSGLIEPLDTSRMPNIGDLAKPLLDQMTVDGKLYAQPFAVAELVMAYRTDMVTEPPKSWADIFDPKYKSCGVAVQSPNTTGGGPELMAGLAKTEGGSPDDPAIVDKIFSVIEAGRDNVVAFPANTSDMHTLLQRGEICVSTHHDGRIIQLAESGVPVAIANPVEGGVAGMNGWAIPVGAENADLAYEFLKFASDPDSQAVFANQIFYATSNLKTPYSKTFMDRRPNGAPDFDNMIFLNSEMVARMTPEWQSRWEAIFR